MENLVSVKIGQVIYQKSEATEGYKPYVVELVANNGLFLRDFDTIYLEDDIGRRFVENHEISEYFSDKV